MDASTGAEINRIVGNRQGEAHPFKRNSAGMEWFSRMIPLVDQLTVAEMQNFLLPMVDELLASLPHCRLCQAKLLVFAEIFCSRRLPLHARAFLKRYQALVRRSNGAQDARDFRAEVYEAMSQYFEAGQ